MWLEVEFSEKPEEIDSTSSASYVYVRKNIKQHVRDEQTVWTAMEQKVPKEMYEYVSGRFETESLVEDEQGNKYEQTIVDGKVALKCVENADGTMNY